MTLEKAIEILDAFLPSNFLKTKLALRDATALGIEALKRESEYRLTTPIMNIVLLPGETG